MFIIHVDNDPNTPAINFLDPRGQTCVLQPQQKRYTIYNSTRHFLKSKVNRMILFPSWLSHFVPINYSKSDRISIAFNAMLKEVSQSEPTNFQSQISND